MVKALSISWVVLFKSLCLHNIVYTTLPHINAVIKDCCMNKLLLHNANVVFLLVTQKRCQIFYKSCFKCLIFP